MKFSEAIAAAFAPGMGEAVLVAEAEERVRAKAHTLGLEGQAIIDEARHRYVESPRAGRLVYIEILEATMYEELT